MTDWNSLPGGLDVSHYQGKIDWGLVEAQNPAVVYLKATQGMSVDSTFDANRSECARRGIRWMFYPFLQASDDEAVARHCASVVGPGVPGVLDWEASGVPAAVTEMWGDALLADTGRLPMCYYGIYPPTPATAKIGLMPRILAQYPGSPAAPPRLPPWSGLALPDWRREWLIWQWTPQGRYSGVATLVDLDRLACQVNAFDQWYRTGELAGSQPAPVPAPAPSPAPVPQGFDLSRLSRQLHVGCTGDDVAALQAALDARGYGLTVDGAFGPGTRRAVVAFERATGDVPDGVVDPGGRVVRALLGS